MNILDKIVLEKTNHTKYLKQKTNKKKNYLYFELSPPQKYRVALESGASLRNYFLTSISDIYL